MVTEKDERYHFVEEVLWDTYKQLITEKDPNSLKVAEVIKRAGIARSTFYSHYVDMPAMQEAMEDRMISEIFQMLTDFHPQGKEETCKAFYQMLCRYISENGFLVRLFQSIHAERFTEKLLNMFHVFVKSALADPARKGGQEMAYAIAYSMGGVIGILHKWTTENCKDSPEQVAEMLTAQFLHGMGMFF